MVTDMWYDSQQLSTALVNDQVFTVKLEKYLKYSVSHLKNDAL